MSMKLKKGKKTLTLKKRAIQTPASPVTPKGKRKVKMKNVG